MKLSTDLPAPLGKKQTRELFDSCDKFTFQVPLIRGREMVEFPVDQEFLTKRYTEEAVKWIREKTDKPFFLYLAHNMPHAPVFASPRFQKRSEGGRYGDVIEEIDWSVGQVMDTLKETGIEQDGGWVFSPETGRHIQSEDNKTTPFHPPPLRSKGGFKTLSPKANS